MRFIVDIEPFEDGWRWQVSDPEEDVIDAGTEADWGQALANAALHMAIRVGNVHGKPGRMFPLWTDDG